MPGWIRFVLNDFAKTPYVVQAQIDQLKQSVDGPSTDTAPNSSNNGNSSNNDYDPNDGAYDQREDEEQEAELALNQSGVNGRGFDDVSSERRRRVHAVVRQAGFATSVLDAYPWQVQSADLLHGIIHIQSKTNAYALKQTHVSHDRVKFLRGLIQYAKSHGYENIAPIVSSRTGKPYVVRQDHVYYASRWMDGQQVNFSSVQQVGQVARALAKFHESTRGFGPDGYRPQSEFDLLHMLRHRRRDLRTLLAEAERKHKKDAFDATLVELSGSLQEDSDQSVALAEQSPCESFLAADKKRPGLCHLDVTPGNFIYDRNKQVILLDLDLATYAPRVLDLSHLLRRSLQQLHWTSEPAYTCFLNYHAERAIEPAEYQLTNALLRFPYRAWRLARARYRLTPDTAQIDAIQEFQSQEPRRQAFLTELKREITRAGA